MAPFAGRSFALAAVFFLFTQLTSAASPADALSPRLRGETADGRAVIDELLDRSATARALMDRLTDSDVIVYVRFRILNTSVLTGRIGVLSSARGVRFLVIELASGQSRMDDLVTLGHELRHAVEIADAPSVVNPGTLAAHYESIGTRVRSSSCLEAFETQAAAETATQVRRELRSRTVTTAQQ